MLYSWILISCQIHVLNEGPKCRPGEERVQTKEILMGIALRTENHISKINTKDREVEKVQRECEDGD